MGKRKKHFIIIIISAILGPLVLLGLLNLLFRSKPLMLFPEGQYNITAYSDETVGGSSKVVQLVRSKDTITFEYIVNQGIEYPFVSVIVYLAGKKNGVDLSKYGTLEIEVKSQNSPNLRLFLKTMIPGYSRLDDHDTWRQNEFALALKDTQSNYRIPLKQFTASEWWYEKYGLNSQDFPEEDFRDCILLEIENGLYMQPGVQDRITIKKIIFHQNKETYYFPQILALVIYYGIMVYMLQKNRKKATKTKKIPLQVEPQGEPLLLTSYEEEDLSRILKIINSSYNQPDLTLVMLHETLGLSTKRISGLLKKRFDLSFKQFLNTVRLKEAKRLLLSTDRNILDIALHVGYRNVTHFNRIFKEIENTSPSVFRSAGPEKPVDSENSKQM